MQSGINLIVWFVGTFGFVILLGLVLKVIARYILFKKAGEPGWASFVPFYGEYLEYKMYCGTGWLFLVPWLATLLCGVLGPFGIILMVASFIVPIIRRGKQAAAYGKDGLFALGCILFNGIFSMILAFGNYQYRGVPVKNPYKNPYNNPYNNQYSNPYNNPNNNPYNTPYNNSNNNQYNDQMPRL